MINRRLEKIRSINLLLKFKENSNKEESKNKKIIELNNLFKKRLKENREINIETFDNQRFSIKGQNHNNKLKRRSFINIKKFLM